MGVISWAKITEAHAGGSSGGKAKAKIPVLSEQTEDTVQTTNRPASFLQRGKSLDSGVVGWGASEVRAGAGCRIQNKEVLKGRFVEILALVPEVSL